MLSSTDCLHCLFSFSIPSLFILNSHSMQLILNIKSSVSFWSFSYSVSCFFIPSSIHFYWILQDSMFYSMSAISILVMNVLWSQEEERRTVLCLMMWTSCQTNSLTIFLSLPLFLCCLWMEKRTESSLIFPSCFSHSILSVTSLHFLFSLNPILTLISLFLGVFPSLIPYSVFVVVWFEFSSYHFLHPWFVLWSVILFLSSKREREREKSLLLLYFPLLTAYVSCYRFFFLSPLNGPEGLVLQNCSQLFFSILRLLSHVYMLTMNEPSLFPLDVVSVVAFLLLSFPLWRENRRKQYGSFRKQRMLCLLMYRSKLESQGVIDKLRAEGRRKKWIRNELQEAEKQPHPVTSGMEMKWDLSVRDWMSVDSTTSSCLANTLLSFPQQRPDSLAVMMMSIFFPGISLLNSSLTCLCLLSTSVSFLPSRQVIYYWQLRCCREMLFLLLRHFISCH